SEFSFSYSRLKLLFLFGQIYVAPKKNIALTGKPNNIGSKQKNGMTPFSTPATAKLPNTRESIDAIAPGLFQKCPMRKGKNAPPALRAKENINNSMIEPKSDIATKKPKIPTIIIAILVALRISLELADFLIYLL